MYQVIKKYCENDTKNGLLLVDMPTGFGKTYSVIKYIFDAAIDENNKNKRYFFITTLKKNLPKDELEKRFNDAGKSSVFAEKFLFIDSNSDCVIDNFTPDVKSQIQSEIKRTEEYRKFAQDVEFLQKQEKVIDGSLRAFVGSIRDNLRTKTEPNFRKLLQGILSKEYQTVEKRLFAIKTEKKWQWVGKLYPAVFTRDKQIIFMSVDKFLSRNTTIIEPSYMLYNSTILDDAIIFIDEFDATKDTLLKKIIKDGLEDKIDYIDLFKAIYSALHTNEFPSILTTSSKQRNSGDYRSQTLQSVIDGIRDKADQIYDNYTLQFNHRTSTVEEEMSKNFLFQDHQFHSILSGNNSFITTVCDTKAKINAIQYSKDRPLKDSNNIQILLGKLRGFIKWFQGGINILAINYMQCKAERRKNGEDEFTLESAIRSVLALFRLNDDYIDYITSQIMISSHKIKGDIEKSDYDLSFYENGFRFYSFEDDSIHDMQSKIMMCSFQTTPEKIILRFCERAKVIGISATATVPSVVGNYDLEYLKSKMQKAYSVVPTADMQRLKRDFQKTQEGYNNIEIEVDLLGDKVRGKYLLESWKSVFKNDEYGEAIFERLQRELPEIEDKNNYNKERYFRIALAYKQFIEHDDIQSFLCVLTKHPRKGDKILNLDTLFEMFSYIHDEYYGSLRPFEKRTIVQLDGEEYESKKDDIMNRLANGEKLFVISVYQTIGAGQNLQYRIPEQVKGLLTRINGREDRGDKDFDAIYLDKPTNLISTLSNNLNEEDFVKYLFQTEFLQEAAEVSNTDAFQHIKKAFKCYISGRVQNDFTKNLYKTESVVLLSTRTVIQAIGRICRTNLKRNKIYIFADDRIAENIDVSIIEDRILNKEFIALIEKIRAMSKKPESRSLLDAAVLTSIRVNKDINNMIREEWTEGRIEKWQKLRDLVLAHPTMSKDELETSFIGKNYYVQLPEPGNTLFYSQDEDYNNINIGFQKSMNLPFVVSAEAAKLDRVLQLDIIKQYFHKKGFATEYVTNDYIMSPPLWNNIYKGALGEVVGRVLFYKVLKVELDEIKETELFELFDYKIKNMPIYIDFKNWHESTFFNDERMLSKIFSKAEKCKCKCVLIANILSETDYVIQSKEKNGIKIVVIPSLLIDDGQISINEEAWHKIRECINENAH